MEFHTQMIHTNDSLFFLLICQGVLKIHECRIRNWTHQPNLTRISLRQWIVYDKWPRFTANLSSVESVNHFSQNKRFASLSHQESFWTWWSNQCLSQWILSDTIKIPSFLIKQIRDSFQAKQRVISLSCNELVLQSVNHFGQNRQHTSRHLRQWITSHHIYSYVGH